MHMNGEPTRIIEWIHGDLCVVKVVVDAIAIAGDVESPYIKPAVARHLEHIQTLADQGKIDELSLLGVVYVRQTA